MKNVESSIAKTVKKIQTKGSAVTDLVFNPVTGEFEEIPHGMVPAVGEVVTEMTKYGFA